MAGGSCAPRRSMRRPQAHDLPAVLPRFTPGGEDLHGINSVEEAFLILSVYSVVFVALALFAYRHRDITTG